MSARIESDLMDCDNYFGKIGKAEESEEEIGSIVEIDEMSQAFFHSPLTFLPSAPPCSPSSPFEMIDSFSENDLDSPMREGSLSSYPCFQDEVLSRKAFKYLERGKIIKACKAIKKIESESFRILLCQKMMELGRYDEIKEILQDSSRPSLFGVFVRDSFILKMIEKIVEENDREEASSWVELLSEKSPHREASLEALNRPVENVMRENAYTRKRKKNEEVLSAFKRCKLDGSSPEKSDEMII